MKQLLPGDLGDWVERATGARIAEVRPRGGGGASREGAELLLDYGDRTVRAYMNYDVNRAGAGDDAAFLREAAILRALSGPLSRSGVRTARLLASIPERRALIAEHVGGESSFNRLTAPADRLAVASDFMAQLAALHRIELAEPIEGMGPLRPIAATVRERLAQLRERNDANGSDPLIALTLDWLGDNIPPEPARIVVVHGDAGPANFLYADGEVMALLDWELVHYGDPMADLAMLCLRMLFQPFVPLPDAFEAYEAAGGVAVDLDRVRFWRLFFQVGFANRARYDDPAAPPPPNLGMNMVYSTIHRRVLAEALAEVSQVDLPLVPLPEAPPARHDRSYAIALDDLRDFIVPRLTDQQAAVKAKGLARLVKWWRTIERLGPGYEAAERRELSEAFGQDFTTLAASRSALGQAVAARTLDHATAIRLCHAQVTRDAALMADAMGGIADTRFAPLA